MDAGQGTAGEGGREREDEREETHLGWGGHTGLDLQPSWGSPLWRGPPPHGLGLSPPGCFRLEG